MIIDADKILQALVEAKVKAELATLVWDMQLENFNAVILDLVAGEISSKLDKITDPKDLHCAEWQARCIEECERFLKDDTAPALALVPWLDKLTGPDMQIIANMAFGGMRHSLLHVRSCIVLIKNKIEKGATLSKITTPGNLQGSLPWFTVSKAAQRNEPEEKVIEYLRHAVGYELEVQYR